MTKKKKKKIFSPFKPKNEISRFWHSMDGLGKTRYLVFGTQCVKNDLHRPKCCTEQKTQRNKKQQYNEIQSGKQLDKWCSIKIQKLRSAGIKSQVKKVCL